MRVANQVYYDIDQNYGNDINLSATDDLNTVTGLFRSQQRILRRLFTNPGFYIWEPTYGAGLPAYVGQNITPDNFNGIKSLILSQIFLEESVAQIPEPIIVLQTIQGGLFCQITYTESSTQQSVVLTFNVSG